MTDIHYNAIAVIPPWLQILQMPVEDITQAEYRTMPSLLAGINIDETCELDSIDVELRAELTRTDSICEIAT